MRAALSDFAFSFGEYVVREERPIFAPQETTMALERKKKVRDHTQGLHLDMFITCVPFGFHNGMDESFSSQQQEVGASFFPLPQTIMLRLVFHRSGRQHVNGSPSAADFWQRRELANHEILTREEDLDLEEKVVRANSLRASMVELIETKTRNLEDEILYQVYSDYSLEESSGNQVDRDDLENIFRQGQRTFRFARHANPKWRRISPQQTLSKSS